MSQVKRISERGTTGTAASSGTFEGDRVASIFLVRDDGALLLQHRDNKPGLPLAGKWVPPGGHCEKAEDIQVCARRELREETGYDCEELYLLGSIMDDNIEDLAPYPLTIFCALYDGMQTLQCLEGQALEFVARADVSSAKMPQYFIEIWDRAIARLNDQKEQMDV